MTSEAVIFCNNNWSSLGSAYEISAVKLKPAKRHSDKNLDIRNPVFFNEFEY